MQFGSALTRLYRVLRNPRFDNCLLTEPMLRLLVRASARRREMAVRVALGAARWRIIVNC